MDDVTNLQDVKDLDQLRKELAAQQRETKAAMLTIQKLLKDINVKNQEIEHLKTMITQTVPVITPSKPVPLYEIPVEEEIAENQLERLRQTAGQRPLTLEETKIFDLLVKNKRLSQEDNTLNMSKRSVRDVSAEDLLQIAGKKDEPDKGN
jgi:hypothetical protein